MKVQTNLMFPLLLLALAVQLNAEYNQQSNNCTNTDKNTDKVENFGPNCSPLDTKDSNSTDAGATHVSAKDEDLNTTTNSAKTKDVLRYFLRKKLRKRQAETPNPGEDVALDLKFRELNNMVGPNVIQGGQSTERVQLTSRTSLFQGTSQRFIQCKVSEPPFDMTKYNGILLEIQPQNGPPMYKPIIGLSSNKVYWSYSISWDRTLSGSPDPSYKYDTNPSMGHTSLELLVSGKDCAKLKGTYKCNFYFQNGMGINQKIEKTLPMMTDDMCSGQSSPNQGSNPAMPPQPVNQGAPQPQPGIQGFIPAPQQPPGNQGGVPPPQQPPGNQGGVPPPQQLPVPPKPILPISTNNQMPTDNVQRQTVNLGQKTPSTVKVDEKEASKKVVGVLIAVGVVFVIIIGVVVFCVLRLKRGATGGGQNLAGSTEAPKPVTGMPSQQLEPEKQKERNNLMASIQKKKTG